MAKVLVVDDQPHIVRVVKLGLERAGFAVDTAGDGEAGLEKLRRERYDALIVDMQMPRMDGQTMCNAMRQEIDAPDLLTLVMTAKTEPELRRWAASIPNTEFLEKPVSLRRLTARLQDHLSPEGRQ